MKRYLIFGGTSGIGLDLSKRLIKNGHEVHIIGRNFEEIEKIESKNIYKHHIEIKSFNELDIFFKTKFFGKVKFDGVVNSVGVERFKFLRMTTNDDIDEIFMPAINTMLAILKYSCKKEFLNDNSSIITMSSVSAFKGKMGMALYGSARATLESLVIHATEELAQKNIRVNAIRAGAVETPMHFRATKSMSDKQLEEFEKSHPLGFGDTKDISNLILFLLSEESKWITGSIITADGGYLSG